MFDYIDPEEAIPMVLEEGLGKPATYDESGAVLKPKRRLERDSRRRLEQLDFDPLESLVGKFIELQKERVHLSMCRSGARVELNNRTGKPIFVKNEDLVAVDNAQVAIAKELMRYAYGRVTDIAPNNDDEEVPMLPIVFSESVQNEDN